MIIVSQDKYNILNFNTTVNIGLEEISTFSNTTQISAQTNGNTIVLGYYSTEERAKEVLQEIINAYCCTKILQLPNVNYKTDISGKDMVKTIAYEMPKE